MDYPSTTLSLIAKSARSSSIETQYNAMFRLHAPLCHWPKNLLLMLIGKPSPCSCCLFVGVGCDVNF